MILLPTAQSMFHVLVMILNFILTCKQAHLLGFFAELLQLQASGAGKGLENEVRKSSLSISPFSLPAAIAAPMPKDKCRISGQANNFL